MRTRFYTCLALALCAVPARAQYQLEYAFPNLAFQAPVDIQCPADFVSRVYVVEKRGVIYVFPEDVSAQPADRHVFLDITAKVRNFGEAGLLGLAFHPDYVHNGYFFVYYVTTFPYRNVLARYRVSGDPNVADAASELILIDQPKNNLFHNGGQLAFGPDGFLYAAMGDDVDSANGQDLDDLFGSLLRIAPNVSGTSPLYTIPNGNPFKGNTSGYREEVFAYGFRNPWRFSFDPATGRLFCADVGEDTFEEIDVVQAGGNYGWPLMEGPDCFQPVSCDTAGKNLSLPLTYYDHGEGIAVIGGHVFHGTRLPELEGLYVFADYSGTVWSLTDDDPPVRSTLVPGGPALTAFGVGNFPKNDLYIASWDGNIYRLARVPTGVADAPGAHRHRLLGNFPNPFNPATTIRYRLENAGRVSIDIVAVGGARVRRLDHGVRAAGNHALGWRGETDAGTRAASGVYFYRLVVDGVTHDTARMVLVQ